MIIVADSGSTQTDWLLFDAEKNSVEVQTIGLNPFIVGEEDVVKVLQDSILPALKDNTVEAVYFYGAGCRGGATNELIRNAIARVLASKHIEVNSDLVGAARATLQNEEGICAILGTGSICGVYVNNSVNVQIPALGYILGDEGSGTWFGKRLLSDYLKRVMPLGDRTAFDDLFSVKIEEVLQATYYEKRPNAYLAQFTRFLSANKQSEYCQNLIKEGFESFVSRNVKPTNETLNTERIGIVGSLAWHFKAELTQILRYAGFKAITILQSPIHLLGAYHERECLK